MTSRFPKFKLNLTGLVSSQLHDPVFFSMLGDDMNTEMAVVGKLLRAVGTRNIFDANMSCPDVEENVLTRGVSLETDGTRRLSRSRIDSNVGLELVVVERGENGGRARYA